MATKTDTYVLSLSEVYFSSCLKAKCNGVNLNKNC